MKRVLGRACRDARAFIGHSWKKTLIGIIIIFFAAVALSLWEGTQQALGKLEWWACGLLAEFAAFLIALPIFLLRAPWLLERETMNAFQAQLDELNDRVAGLEAKENARLKKEADAEQKALSHSNMNRLQYQLGELMEGAKASYPRVDSVALLAIKQREHGEKTKASLTDWLKRAREEASKVSLGSYLPQISEVEETASDCWQLEKVAKRMADAVNAVLRRLEQ